MDKIAEIRQFKEYVVTDRSDLRVKGQKDDLSFFEDKYPMPLIKDEDYQIRTGNVATQVNSVTNQMIGDNPRCYTRPYSDKNEKIKEACANVASEGNRWLRAWLRQYSNPYRETFKYGYLFGEAWIYIVHNEYLSKYKGRWQKNIPDSVPVIPIIYNPMVVFHDPAEDIKGRPGRVVISFQRSIGDIRAHYPNWNPSEIVDKKITDKVDFFLYVDEDYFYAEASKVPLFTEGNEEGLRANVYKEVPFTHIYAGWGIATHDKEPALLAYSKVRMSRELITEASTLHSDAALNAHNYAHEQRNLIIPAGTEMPDDPFAEYANTPDGIHKIFMPEGGVWDKEEGKEFSDAFYHHLASIESKLSVDYPVVLSGGTPGSSGRQDDRANQAAKSLYDCLKENNDKLWAEAVSLGMRICSKVPGMIPDKLNRGDCDSYSELTVDLGKVDPIELSRKMAQGQMLFERGLIDHKTYLMEYAEKTEEEANRIIYRTYVEKVMREHPAVSQLIIEEVGERMGKSDRLAQLQSEMGEAVGSVNPLPQYGVKGGESRTGNIKTESGREMADLASAHEPRLSGA